MLAVADGVGGREVGDIASRMAIATLLKCRLNMSCGTNPNECAALMREAMQSANLFLFKINRQFGNPKFATGTTLTVLHLMPESGVVFSIGDSRCYRLHKKRLESLTHDDTWAQRLVDQRKLASKAAKIHPLSNTLYRCLGSSPALGSGFKRIGYHSGDRFLLATDGIWKVLDEDRMELALAESGSAKEAVDRLVMASLRCGARDNLAACAAFVR